MGQELAIIGDRKNDGPAMAKLSDQRRKFVIEMVDKGINPKAASKAAVKCGYSSKYGSDLMRDEAILRALREEAGKKLVGGVLIGVNVLLEIANDPIHKDRFKAAARLTELNGFTTEQKIRVEHVTSDSKTMIVEIRSMAKELGMDPAAVLRSIGVEDAEFSELPEDTEMDAVENDYDQ